MTAKIIAKVSYFTPEELLKRYPSPDKSPLFKKKWRAFILDVANRNNFKESHLEQVKILCQLFVEEDEYRKTLKKEGDFYESFDKFGGVTWKVHPAKLFLQKTREQIKGYMAALGMRLTKDTEISNAPEKNNKFAE